MIVSWFLFTLSSPALAAEPPAPPIEAPSPWAGPRNEAPSDAAADLAPPTAGAEPPDAQPQPLDANAESPEPEVAPEQASPQARAAEVERLEAEVVRLAGKGHWKGVLRTHDALTAFGPVPAQTLQWAAQASIQLGDTWTGYLRWVQVARVDATPGVHNELAQIRTDYGRLTVRRFDTSPIELTATEMPFRPDLRASIQAAQEQLRTTGGFDGMIPMGSYDLGGQPVQVSPKPVVIQRRPARGS